jgi:hypothetical protein
MQLPDGIAGYPVGKIIHHRTGQDQHQYGQTDDHMQAAQHAIVGFYTLQGLRFHCCLHED